MTRVVLAKNLPLKFGVNSGHVGHASSLFRWWTGILASGVEILPRLLPIAISILVPSMAAAQVLPLDVLYGNVDGCPFHQTGFMDNDGGVALSNAGVETLLTSCTFDHILKAEGTDTVVEATCQSEGEIDKEVRPLTIADRGAEGLFVKVDHDVEWGPLFPCQ